MDCRATTQATQVAQPTVKHLGFKVRDALAPPRSPRPAEEPPAPVSDPGEAWQLPLSWRPTLGGGLLPPLPAGPELGSSLLSCASEGFKGFKDCCEAGSFSLGSPAPVLSQSGRVEVMGAAHTAPAVRSLVKAVTGGLRACQPPEPSSEGLGGTYFFLDELGGRRAIVKPCDEEPLAPNNPKGFVGRALGEPGLKPSVRVGEAAMREVAAFLLDRDGFAGVPPTVLARVTHSCFHIAPGQPPAPPQLPPAEQPGCGAEGSMSCSQASAASVVGGLGGGNGAAPAGPPSKLASLQEFVPHRCDASELGTSRFSVKDVHRIGILDLRLFNTDRHAGNMLVRPLTRPAAAAGPGAWLPQLQLIPIDHGFCLPEALEAPYLEWLHWPQAMMPFDEEELAYIASLDAAADVAFLRRELPWLPEGSLRTLQVATLLLQRCAAAGLTLAEIGGVASRPLVGLDEEPSQLETACLAARARVDALSEEDSEAGAAFSDEEAGSEGEAGGGVGPLLCADDSCGSPMDDARTVSTRSGVSASEALQFFMEPAASGDLLFDLDEEPAAPPPAPALLRGLSLGRARASPAPRSPLRPVASEAVLARPRTASPGSEPRGPAPAAGLARSLATGMLAQHAARRPGGRAYRGASAGPRATPKRRLRQAYPPPVVGTHRSGLSGAFDGLDSAGWADFMAELALLVEEALQAGTWRQQPDQAGQGKLALGASCPRF